MAGNLARSPALWIMDILGIIDGLPVSELTMHSFLDSTDYVARRRSRLSAIIAVTRVFKVTPSWRPCRPGANGGPVEYADAIVYLAAVGFGTSSPCLTQSMR